MFYAYGISSQGADHIRNGVVCQDSHKIIRCGEDMIIAAVADGLGSEKYTDKASKLAVHISTTFCRKKLNKNSSSKEILEVIQNSFTTSQTLIEKFARKADHDIDQYDTTLSLAVLINDRLYYGQSGDSGILAMGTDGAFYQVTEQQRDEEGRVFPLIYSDCWTFGEYEKPVESVLLATDGMLETFFPIYIKDEPVNIHVALAKFFMDRDSLKFEETGEETVQRNMEKFIDEIDRKRVSDDKTIVVLVNGSVPSTRQPKEYYEEPDWDALSKKHKDAWRRMAYPDLYKEEDAKPEEAQETHMIEEVEHDADSGSSERVDGNKEKDGTDGESSQKLPERGDDGSEGQSVYAGQQRKSGGFTGFRIRDIIEWSKRPFGKNNNSVSDEKRTDNETCDEGIQ